MKRIIHKVTGLFLSIAMVFCFITPALAMDSEDGEGDVDFGSPIRIIEYIDEDGNQVVEKIYFAPDSGSSEIYISENGDISVQAETSGSGWYQKEKQIANADPETKMYVKAYFVWGNGDVTVSNPKGWYENLAGGQKVSNEQTTTGTGRFVGIFNKYAYAEYTFTTTNPFGIKQDNEVKVTVSQNGNVS